MKKHINAKKIRNNDLERYLNESSFCYQNIGLPDDDVAEKALLISSYMHSMRDDFSDETEGGDADSVLTDFASLYLILDAFSDYPAESNEESAFYLKNAFILKNRSFLQGFNKLFHRDKSGDFSFV